MVWWNPINATPINKRYTALQKSTPIVRVKSSVRSIFIDQKLVFHTIVFSSERKVKVLLFVFTNIRQISALNLIKNLFFNPLYTKFNSCIKPYIKAVLSNKFFIMSPLKSKVVFKFVLKLRKVCQRTLLREKPLLLSRNSDF